MPHPFTDDLPEYRLPGVDPPRPGMMTFSAQRFYPPAAAPRNGGIPGQSSQALAVVDSTEVSPNINALVAPILPTTLLSRFLTLLDTGAMSLRSSVWIRKLHSCYEDRATRARMAKKKLSESLTAVKSYALNGFKCMWDFTVQATGLFRRRAMNAVEPLANSRLPTIRVEM